MNILVIHGPNLNLLGLREPSIYGNFSLNDLIDEVKSKNKNINFDFFQSNHEGEIIDRLHLTLQDKTDGIILNAGALTHYSYSLRDAIASIKIPVVEVHISNIHAREDFRKISVIQEVCVSQISGLGIEGYNLAVKILSDRKND